MQQQILAAYGAAGAPPSTPYYDAVMLDSPELYFRFGENVSGAPVNSGSLVLASASYNNAARGRPTLCGDAGDYSVGVSAGSGIRGPSVSVAPGSFGKSNDFTLEAIIKPSSLSSSGAIISCSVDDAPELRIISGKISLIRRNVAVVATQTGTLATGTRYHVACRVAVDGTYTFFINGIADGTGAGYASFSVASGMEVGYESAGNSVFVGDIDEVALYYSGLSDARIAAHAAAMA